MTLEYTNRKGIRYFVMQGQTKTGKVKYYSGRKLNAEGVVELPPEFEIYERPETAIVTVRKVLPTRILPAEKIALDKLARELAEVEDLLVEATADSLIVYVCNQTREEVDHIMRMLFGPSHTAEQRRLFTRQSDCHPMYRFVLQDDARRLFKLDRWCFRGRIDGWIPLTVQGDSLLKIAKKYLPHLGRESFYDLI